MRSPRSQSSKGMKAQGVWPDLRHLRHRRLEHSRLRCRPLLPRHCPHHCLVHYGGLQQTLR